MTQGVEVGNSRRVRFASAAVATGLLAATLAGCSGGGSAGGDTAASADLGAATGTIKVWAQQGQEGEVKAIQDQVAAFNKAQSDVKVELQLLPQGTYDQTLQTTKAADLPDAFEFGGETMAALVYAGKLREVTGAVTQATLDSEISSVVAQNTYPGDGKQYAVSQYDSGLALFGNKKLLDGAGVSYPTTIDQAWTFQQFADAVKALAAKDKDGKSLSIEENYAGQWPGYAFTPIVNSAGFPLVGADGKSVGNLNAPAVATALTDFAALREYTDANADDLAFHSWAISSTSKSAAAAGKFLDWVMADAAVKQVTDSNGAPPGTTSVTASSKLYAPGGALQLYADQLAKSCGSNPPTPDCVTVPRTISAAWPVINDTFSKAFWAIWQGGDAQSELDKAAKAIDLDYEDNDSYQ
jgi:multiple sugar transport system substrate-binding protein